MPENCYIPIDETNNNLLKEKIDEICKNNKHDPQELIQELQEQHDEYIKKADTCISEIDRLATWIMTNCPEEIEDESAVDVAIRLLEDYLQHDRL